MSAPSDSGKPRRVGRRSRNDQLLVGEAGDASRHRARPGEHELRQDKLPLHRRHGGRDVGGIRIEKADLVLVDVAERADAGKKQRPSEMREEALADGARGAPRRQIERHVGECEGLASVKAVDQPAIEKRRDQRVEKRRAGRDSEDIRPLHSSRLRRRSPR